jgi:hypothetical protein
MAAPSDKLAPLGIFIGTWDTTIVPNNPDGSDGAPSQATDTYEWSPNGQFLYHFVDAMLGGERMQSMEVAAAQHAAGHYLTHSYDADGTVNSFSATLSDRTWLLTGDTQRFTGQFNEEGTVLTGQWEQRGDAGNWSPLMTVTLRKRDS